MFTVPFRSFHSTVNIYCINFLKHTLFSRQLLYYFFFCFSLKTFFFLSVLQNSNSKTDCKQSSMNELLIFRFNSTWPGTASLGWSRHSMQFCTQVFFFFIFWKKERISVELCIFSREFHMAVPNKISFKVFAG